MLTIGQMSKACSVTVKTLRHYDKIGLFKPEYTDEFTGYRYYTEQQIRIMLLIARYKRYGFSLSEIQKLLETDDVKLLEKLLERQRIRLERQRDHIAVTMGELERHLRDLERTGDIMSYQNQYEVVLKETEELALLTTRQKMSVEEYGTYYGKIFERITREGINAEGGTTLAIYHDEEYDPAYNDTELGVIINDRDKADRILPSRLCAVITHIGPYSSLPDAYGKIVAWTKAQGYRMADAPYEIYHKTAFNGLPPEEWETEIFFPVKK